MQKRSRQSSESFGRGAETYAAIYLRICGYKILARREKTPFGEIDLIARKAGLLVFIEVKYRRDKAALTTSLSPQSQQRIIKAAHYLTSRTPKFQTMNQRFDLVFTAPLGPFPLGYMDHLKDAFRPY